jgi:hypothetical protein
MTLPASPSWTSLTVTHARCAKPPNPRGITLQRPKKTVAAGYSTGFAVDSGLCTGARIGRRERVVAYGLIVADRA